MNGSRDETTLARSTRKYVTESNIPLLVCQVKIPVFPKVYDAFRVAEMGTQASGALERRPVTVAAEFRGL